MAAADGDYGHSIEEARGGDVDERPMRFLQAAKEGQWGLVREMLDEYSAGAVFDAHLRDLEEMNAFDYASQAKQLYIMELITKVTDVDPVPKISIRRTESADVPPDHGDESPLLDGSDLGYSKDRWDLGSQVDIAEGSREDIEEVSSGSLDVRYARSY